MKYKTLIFDLDDTLINNQESIRYAFKQVLTKLNIPYTDELFNLWFKHDCAYWSKRESGNMPLPDYIKTLEDKKNYLRSNRFILFFKELNLTYESALLLNEIYCDALGENIVPIKDANILLEELKSSYEIAIASNGPTNAAIKKVEKANLMNYINLLVTSEEVGFSKPSLKFYSYLFDKLQNKDKQTMLMIGDSLVSDIQGGINNNIDTCWYNPNNSPSNNINPTYTINTLLELKKKL